METSSTINGKWVLCILTSFISCFILLLWIQHDHEGVHLQALRNGMISKSVEFLKQQQSYLENEKPLMQAKKAKTKCNVFEGRWTYKPLENPIYDASKCPFLSDQVSCQRNGRPDADYEKWSWEANDCEISRFDAINMLEMLRGKRVILVGDSLNRNQWESLACLLYSAIPSSRAHVDFRSGFYKVFKAMDYNVSVEFYWSPFLVQLESNHANGSKILMLDKIDASGDHWKGADVMVFNTGHWWVHIGKFKAWDSFQYSGKLIPQETKLESTFEMAMTTWAHWIDNNVNSSRTSVFYRSISPEHKGKNGCYNKTKPLLNNESHVFTWFPNSFIKVVENTILGMTTPVKYLNITKLSEHRIDAHPTVYATKKIDKKAYADCSHWCLPGLPDTWNRLLYASLAFDGLITGADS